MKCKRKLPQRPLSSSFSSTRPLVLLATPIKRAGSDFHEQCEITAIDYATFADFGSLGPRHERRGSGAGRRSAGANLGRVPGAAHDMVYQCLAGCEYVVRSARTN